MGSTLLTIEGRDFVVRRPSDLHKLLTSVARLLAAGRVEEALRDIDREWRTRKQNRRVMAPIYAHLLIRHRSSWTTAIALLNYALATDPGPDVEADFAFVLQQTGQHEAALQRLDSALRRYGASPKDRLAMRAREALRGAPSPFAGWACLTPRLSIHVEAVSRRIVTFEARSEAGKLLARKRASPMTNGLTRAELRVPRVQGGVRVTANGRPLLGGEQHWPKDFGIDGRATFHGRTLRGWVRMTWCPSLRPRLVIRDQAGRSARITADTAMPAGAWGFALDPRAQGLSGERFDLDVRLPDGSRQPLPGSPALTPRFARARLPRAQARRKIPRLDRIRPVDVIVPVYQDRERTLACLQAVIETRSGDVASIIVVDDASPDPFLSADLQALAREHDLHLLRNEKNLGFAASVNRAMQCNPAHDAVLVNSDVVVFGDWLQRLRRAAHSSDDIGTVTPLADDDSVVGYRSAATQPDPVATARHFDEARAQASPDVVDLPVGVGFCLYIRRDCWAQTGPLDVDVFGSGYGEEADFCMRARKLGWRHVLASNVFVHHAGSKSFGARRAALLDRSAQLLGVRHPGYHQMVADFRQQDPLLPIRRELDLGRLRQLDKPIALIVTLALPGGVDRFVAERSRQLRHEGKVPVILRPATFFDAQACVLRCDALELADLEFRIPQDLALLGRLLESLEIAEIEFHHFLGLDPRVVGLVRRLAAPLDIYLHDYSWICPRVTLVDGSHSYCGEPAVAACERCIRKNGSSLLEEISVASLRKRSREWLRTARRVIAPSHDTRKRMEGHVPGITVEVVPHETFLSTAPPRPAPAREVVRVALLGALGYHKGYKVLLDCARHAAAHRLPLEFVVVGFTEDDELLEATGRIFITGRYDDSEAQSLLAREAPDLVFLSSVWPETWCYTLSHALSSGLPIVAFDIGAIGERLRAENRGTLLPLGLSPARINQRLVEIGRAARRPGVSTSSSSIKRAVREGAQPGMWNPENG